MQLTALRAADDMTTYRMRSLAELVVTQEPGILSLRSLVSEAEVACEILEPSDRREQVLLGIQVTTRSMLGALAYETGGLVVDGGWLRFLGSGSDRIQRDLLGWNQHRAHDFCLIADDAAGGFFALNGGRFDGEIGGVHYWAPDSLEWEPLGLRLTDFLRFCLSRRLDAFYADLRWGTWRADVAELPSDRCFMFYPFLWTKEGSLEGSNRRQIPVAEAFDFKVDMVTQLGGTGGQ